MRRPLTSALLVGALVTIMAATPQKPDCEHENTRLVLERPPTGPEEDAALTLTQKLSQRLDEALSEWSASPTGCRAEVVWKGSGHCGTVFELPGAYNFHGHGAHLTVTSECAGAETSASSSGSSSSSKAPVVYLHSAHNVYLFHFTGGASVHARGIGF